MVNKNLRTEKFLHARIAKLSDTPGLALLPMELRGSEIPGDFPGIPGKCRISANWSSSLNSLSIEQLTWNCLKT